MKQTVAISVAAAVVISGAEARAQPEGSPRADPTWVLSSGASVVLFPTEDVYPVYIADPHRPTNVIAGCAVLDSGMAGTGGPLSRLGAGGRFGVLRVAPARADARSWQVSIEAGLDAIFDSQHRLDVIGWDGNYGLTVTTASASPIALKLAVLHISAHLGDEFQNRTGRERINYTREEVSIGVAARLAPNWRVYGETGVAYRRGDPLLEPWRLQWGVEHESQRGPCGPRIACYAAVDFSSTQERGWRTDVSVDLGVVARRGGRASRLFLEWHLGRPTVSEFYLDTISTLGVGLKIDL